MEEIYESMDAVAACLEESAKHGLDVEVVTFALRSMQQNPKQTISEAINEGFNEWVK